MRLLRNNTVTISNVTRQLHKEEVWILIIRKYMKNNPLLRDVRKKRKKRELYEKRVKVLSAGKNYGRISVSE